MNFSQQFQQVQNSVIKIFSVTGQAPNFVLKHEGTGILIGDGTKMITCSHCIIANTLIGVFRDGQDNGQFATAIFNDNQADVAILQVPISMGVGVTLGDSELVQIGQEAFVAGYPYYSQNITALFAHIAGFEMHNNNKLIKIDSSINHGNSGGPLFNSAGELIGIVNLKFGGLSDFLNQIEQVNLIGGMAIGGIDPVQAIQQLITEMKRNLNLGVGTAIPLRMIGNLTNHVGELLNNPV